MAKYLYIVSFYFSIILIFSTYITDSQHTGKIGQSLMNVGANQCLSKAKQVTRRQLNSTGGVLRRMLLTQCSADTGGHPDKFIIEETEFNGHFLEIVEETTNYSRNTTTKSCLYTGFGKRVTLWSDLCDLWNEWQGWNIEKLDGPTKDEFLLYHRASGRCAMVIRGNIKFSKICNQNDKKMKWKFVPLTSRPRTAFALQM